MPTIPRFMRCGFWEHLTGDNSLYYKLSKAFRTSEVEEDKIDGSVLIEKKIKEIAAEITEKEDYDFLISEKTISLPLLGTSSATIKGWGGQSENINHLKLLGISGFEMEDLRDIEDVAEMLDSRWSDEFTTRPVRVFNSIELFAGGGGTALGMEKAGFRHVLLNELTNRHAIHSE